MGKALRRLMFVAVAAGGVLVALKRLGLFGGAECSTNCDCSRGAAACYCGHKTCLAPAPGL